ncbi:MAG: hypothetical protein HAW66_00800 [Shewanella sp.]|nr:hypothetical protein [Shewanella sp.]
MTKLLALVVIVGLLVFLFNRARRKDNSETMSTSEQAPAETEEVTSVEDAPKVEAQVEKESETTNTEAPIAVDNAPQLDWADDNLVKAIAQVNGSDDSSTRYQAMLSAIAVCYKQRKAQQYLIFGYSLSQQYQALFGQQDSTANLNGTGFMQLATLATDNGDFDLAISLCQQAVDNELSDGTVTGFEGRIKRIQQAQKKAAK